MKLSYEERQCLLNNEVPNSSSLKVYTEQNCRYECKTRYAMNKCECIRMFVGSLAKIAAFDDLL